MIRLIYSSVVLFCLLESLRAYQVPSPRILASLKGLEVTIPHESGITSVHVEVSRNSNTTTDNSSTWAGQSLLSQDYTNWVYQTIRARFEVGDILHCRISVTKDNQNYDKNVSIPIEYSGRSASPYKIPSPTIEVYPKGFKLFIPHEYGITFVFVEGKRNEEITKLFPSTWTGFSSPSACSRSWIYRNDDAELKLGDTLYYRILVTKDGKLYTKEESAYIGQSYVADTPLSAGTTTSMSIEVYHRGFEISIPHEEGITQVSVETKCNTGVAPGNAATSEIWEGLFSLACNNTYWVYKNSDAKLRQHDTLYFTITVSKGDEVYTELKGAYEVKNDLGNDESDNCCIS